MSGSGWIVARTKPGREIWAAENVARQGYTYYFPRVLAFRKGVARAEPLFHNYLFVQSLSGAWKYLLGTFGISGVVTFGESPAFLSQNEIDKLKKKEVDGLIRLDKLNEDRPRFTPGQEIRVKGGVFSGYKGLYEGLDPRQREKILLDFLGRKIPLLLAPELVEAA